MKVIENVLKKRSKVYAKEKSNAQIYKYAATLVVILLGLVSLYSIYASKGKIQDYISPHLPFVWLGDGLSIIASVLLELATLAFLYAFYYLVLKGRVFSKAFFIFVALTIGMYSANFWLSTNGLANRAAEATDKTESYNTSFKQDSMRVYTYYSTRIDSLHNINSQLSGVNTLFNYEQLQNNYKLIESLSDEFISEKNRLNRELQEFKANNETVTTSAADDSYSFFAIVQLVQIALHFFISYVYIIVYKEELTEDQYKREFFDPAIKKAEKEMKQQLIDNATSFMTNISDVMTMQPEKLNGHEKKKFRINRN